MLEYDQNETDVRCDIILKDYDYLKSVIRSYIQFTTNESPTVMIIEKTVSLSFNGLIIPMLVLSQKIFK